MVKKKAQPQGTEPKPEPDDLEPGRCTWKAPYGRCGMPATIFPYSESRKGGRCTYHYAGNETCNRREVFWEFIQAQRALYDQFNVNMWTQGTFDVLWEIVSGQRISRRATPEEQKAQSIVLADAEAAAYRKDPDMFKNRRPKIPARYVGREREILGPEAYQRWCGKEKEENEVATQGHSI